MKKLIDMFPTGILVDGVGNVLTEPVAPHTYQSKPKTVAAIQLVPENFGEIERVFKVKIEESGEYYWFTDEEGDDGFFDPGDWIYTYSEGCLGTISDAEFREEFEV